MRHSNTYRKPERRNDRAGSIVSAHTTVRSENEARESESSMHGSRRERGSSLLRPAASNVNASRASGASSSSGASTRARPCPTSCGHGRRMRGCSGDGATARRGGRRSSRIPRPSALRRPRPRRGRPARRHTRKRGRTARRRTACVRRRPPPRDSASSDAGPSLSREPGAARRTRDTAGATGMSALPRATRPPTLARCAVCGRKASRSTRPTRVSRRGEDRARPATARRA